jgi:hypothetical protein
MAMPHILTGLKTEVQMHCNALRSNFFAVNAGPGLSDVHQNRRLPDCATTVLPLVEVLDRTLKLAGFTHPARTEAAQVGRLFLY